MTKHLDRELERLRGQLIEQRSGHVRRGRAGLLELVAQRD